MPFGIDTKQIQQVVKDIADIKAQQVQILAKLDQLLKSDNQTVINPADKP